VLARHGRAAGAGKNTRIRIAKAAKSRKLRKRAS
jgi:hypothetical protein